MSIEKRFQQRNKENTNRKTAATTHNSSKINQILKEKRKKS